MGSDLAALWQCLAVLRLAFETVESELRFALAKAAARQRISCGSRAAGTAMAAAQTAHHSCTMLQRLYVI